jgi:hypothetical protein
MYTVIFEKKKERRKTVKFYFLNKAKERITMMDQEATPPLHVTHKYILNASPARMLQVPLLFPKVHSGSS